MVKRLHYASDANSETPFKALVHNVLPITHEVSVTKKSFNTEKVDIVIKLEPKALEGKFLSYTEFDSGFLVFLPKSFESKEGFHWKVFIKECEVGLNADNTALLNF